MRAYETPEGLIELYNNEPDEIITREEFDRRNEEVKLNKEIDEVEKHLAALKAKKASMVSQTTANPHTEVAPETTSIKRRW